MKMFSLILAVSVFAISLPMSATRAAAQEESDKVTLFPPESLSTPEIDIPVAQDEQDVKLPSLVVSATGYEMPQSRVSSDITVITKENISHLPVHDVGEALSYTTGLVVDKNGAPGQSSGVYLQGYSPRQVKILIDGIPLELLSEGSTDLSLIPLANVERIEILKGSASSVWGASLGGVINIITRKPSDEPTGDIGVSVGERNTRRYNGMVIGKTTGVGYFLSASRFETDGFFSHQKAEGNNFYGKLTTEFGEKVRAEVSYGNNAIERGNFELPIFGYFEDARISDSYERIGLDYTPNNKYDLSLSLYNRDLYNRIEDTYIGSPSPYSNWIDRESTHGASLKSVWRHSEEGTFSFGAEAERASLDLSTETKNYDTEKKAVYINESYRLGNLDIAVGARFDDDSVFGSEASPSAGLVYNTGMAQTLLRLNAARGFTPPPLLYRYLGVTPNKDLNAERAWTYQAGIETRALPGLWSKVTFYRADVTDGVTAVPDTGDLNGNGNTWETLYWKNLKNSRRQGVEVELKTNEYKGVSLSYGYAFNDVKDLDTNEVVKDRPRVTHDVGIDYRGPFDTRTAIKGHYVAWNPDKNDGMYGKYYTTKDENFIWDARVSKYLAKWKGVMGEMFASVHNITDEDQYRYSLYPNPGRWVEGGLSLTFY